MQNFEVSRAVRPIYESLGVKRLMSLGRERDRRTYFLILLLIDREGSCVTECCEECVSKLKKEKEVNRQNFTGL